MNDGTETERMLANCSAVMWPVTKKAQQAAINTRITITFLNPSSIGFSFDLLNSSCEIRGISKRNVGAYSIHVEVWTSFVWV